MLVKTKKNRKGYKVTFSQITHQQAKTKGMLCVITNNDKEMKIEKHSTQFVKSGDRFAEKIGRKMTMKKAIAHMPKEERISFWDKYKTEYPDYR
jgi:hypothetical protein